MATDTTESPVHHLDRGRERERGVLTATLPDGRVLWVRSDAGFVTLREVDRLSTTAEQKARDLQQLARTNIASGRRLSRVIRRDVGAATESTTKDAEETLRKLAARNAKLKARLAKAESGPGSAHQVDRLQSRHRLRKLLDQLVVVTAMPLFAAYGQRRNPLAENNVTIALVTALWLLGDEIRDRLSSSKRTDGPDGEIPLIWSVVAPIGNVVTGWWLLRGLPHERFVTGMVGLAADQSDGGGRFLLLPALGGEAASRRDAPPKGRVENYVAALDLKEQPHTKHLTEMERPDRAPAVAAVQKVEFSSGVTRGRIVQLTAKVEKGYVVVSAQVSGRPAPGQRREPLVKSLQVVWLVDIEQRPEPGRA